MPYSSGTYSLPSGNPVVTGTTISSSTTNTTNSDIATALSTCVLKDGTQTITANLPMASHKLTGLSAGTTAGDSVEYGGSPSFTNLAYTGTLTGSTGILNIGSGQLYKDASGNVGIGTSSPSYRLEVKGASATAGQLSIHDGTGDTTVSGATAGSLLFQARDSSIRTIAEIDAVNTTTNGTGGAMVFQTRISDALAERMRIDSAGNVGIGTSSPNKQLQIQYGSTNSGQLQITNNSTGTTATDGVLFGYDTSNDVIINNQEATATKLYTSGTERMRIDSSGNVGIGTSSPATKLQVSGDVTIYGTPSSTVQGVQFRNLFNTGAHLFSQGAATTNAYISWINGNGTVGSIAATGSGVAYNTSSDYRLKNTIAPMTGALDKVTLLKPVTYKWNSDGSDGQGFIAHELAEVCPHAVTGGKDAVDKDGNPLYQGIDTSFLVATLTAAIQELKAIIDTQQEQINSLLGK
jgi:hypothetical protein